MPERYEQFGSGKFTQFREEEYIVEEIIVKTEKDEEKEGRVPWMFLILFYFLGTISFTPQNFYVTANEYWMYKFRDPNMPFNKSDTADKTDLQKQFTAYAGIAGNIGMITFLILMALVLKKISLHKRIIGSMGVLLTLFTVTLLFIHVDTDSWQRGFFAFSLGIGALLNGTSAVLLVSLFQLSSKFPPRCLVGQLAGLNICGILASVIQIIALAVAPTVKATATLHYFVATMTIASVVIIYVNILIRSEDFQNKLREEPVETEPSEKKDMKAIFALVKKVFRKLWLMLLSIVLAVSVSAILHPGMTSLIESSGKGTSEWSNTYFLPVCVYFLYNTVEFIGRETTNYIAKLSNIYLMSATAFLRLIFFPLIILCNLQPRNHLPVVFESDAYFIIFMIILALTGGYLANIGILILPKYCEKDEVMIGTLLIVMIMIVVIPLTSILSGVFVGLL